MEVEVVKNIDFRYFLRLESTKIVNPRSRKNLALVSYRRRELRQRTKTFLRIKRNRVEVGYLPSSKLDRMVLLKHRKMADHHRLDREKRKKGGKKYLETKSRIFCFSHPADNRRNQGFTNLGK